MPYYHVRIAKKGGKTRWAFAFDLSKKQVEDKIITPFTHWEPFMCGRSPIEPSNVDHIRIGKTGESSSQILAKTKWKRLGERLIGRFGDERMEYLNEWYIIKAGKDVTRDLIKGFSLSKEVSRTFVKKENVFIVHGRDAIPLKELRTMLEEFGLNPIILHEKPSSGMTLAEKLENYSEDVGYAFVILTPDDVGVSFSELYDQATQAVYEGEDEAMKAAKRILAQSKGDVQRFIEFNRRFVHDPSDVMEFLSVLKARARQNVIFEMGYFWGLLKRKKVCCLLKGNVEKPSDIEGIVYIPFKESVNEARDKIAKELKAAGYETRIL